MTEHVPGEGGDPMGRVAALKERVEQGEYRVPAEQVADAVILWYRRMEPGQSEVSSPTSS